MFMAEIKDKVVTVESLSTLHEHNTKTYMSMSNPAGNGSMTMNGDALFSGNVDIGSLTIGSKIKLVPTEDGIDIVFLESEESTETESTGDTESQG